MVLYPAAQAEARNEVDRVVGSARLPEWEDRQNMPHLRRCLEETLRCEYEFEALQSWSLIMTSKGHPPH